jgi:hypothetical protein
MQLRRRDLQQRAPLFVSLQVDDAGVIVEELAAILGYLRGDAVRILDLLLAQLLQDAAETVVPQLLLFGRFAWVCSTKLHKQFLTCNGRKSVCVKWRATET